MTAEAGSAPPDDRSVRMAVDDTRCIGSGQCELLAAEAFEVDDDSGIASVVGTGRLARAAALELVDRCPSGAISFAQIDEG